jgi:hypothetical protein
LEHLAVYGNRFAGSRQKERDNGVFFLKCLPDADRGKYRTNNIPQTGS